MDPKKTFSEHILLIWTPKRAQILPLKSQGLISRTPATGPYSLVALALFCEPGWTIESQRKSTVAVNGAYSSNSRACCGGFCETQQ